MRPSSAPLLLSALLVAGAGLGCANEVVASADANTSSLRTLLVVEQNASVNTAETPRSHASVWFMRVSDEASVDAVTRLVTDLIEVPGNGQCVNPAVRKPQAIPAGLGPVELAFAGEVSVGTSTARAPLSVRAFPDVGNVVSGVMYTAPGQGDLGAPLGGLLTVWASGADGLGGMVADTDAPSPPRLVRIDGRALESADLEARPGQALSLTWQPGTASDLIYVDIDPVPGSPSDRVRCAMPDTGSGSVASLAIPETSMLNLSIHRVRVAPLRNAMGEVGTAHFDVAVAGRVKVAAP